jgi:hypothetical protein
VVGVAVAGATDPSRLVTRDRTVVDLPDDASGPQVHFLYVVPRDGQDRSLDLTSVITRSVASWQAWLMRQTGNRILRTDTYRGELDISFFRLATDDAAVASRREYVRDQIEEELHAAGFNSPTKMYSVYYDGSSSWSCGGGDPDPSMRGNFSALYLKGTPPGAPPCASNVLGADPPGYLEFAMLHELVHSLGFVPRCAPHARGDYDAGHVSDSPFDLMWAGPEPWGTNQPQRMQLDVGRDDYFLASVPGCSDLSSSPYLATVHSVSVTVNGPGTVTSNPPGVDCPATCTGSFERPVTLTATATTGAVFVGWKGACAGTGSCVLEGDGSVTATFAYPSHRRTLTLRVRARRATGVLHAVDGHTACHARVSVILERRRSGGWSVVRRVRTTGTGEFVASIPAGRASYRARAPAVTVAGQRCLTAVSRAVPAST